MSSGLNTQDDPDARTYLYSDFHLLGRMFRYLLKYRLLFAVVSVLVAIGIAVGIMLPFVLQHAIDVDFPTALQGDLAAITMTALLYVVLQLIQWIAGYGTEYLTAQMGQNAVYEIRQSLYSKLQVMSQDFYDRSASGRVISRITSDIDRISDLMSGGLISTFAQVFIIVAIGIVIFTVDLELAIASLSVVPLLLITTVFFRQRLRNAYRNTRKTISSVTANFAESILGAKVTKSFAREKINIENFDVVNQADYQSNIDAGKAQAAFFPSIRFIGGLGVFLIIWLGGLRLIDGTITLGTVVLFIQFSDSFFRPILIIADFYTSVQSAFAGGERVFAILDENPTITDSEDAVDMPEIEGRIVFDDVTFGYVKDTPVLVDFDLEISPGETVALVGDTGAGKTTVVSLLNRFYDIWEGAVKIDEIDVRNVKQKSLHSKIGLVLQDPFLFMGTIKDNIKYGRPDATDEEIYQATEIIGAKHIFEELEMGFDTDVGERGGRLSEGERQLVSFARALLANPAILILDEATSSVDIYTEYAIQRGMKALLKGRTSIVVAHRLSTIVNADRILVLEHGKIVESGKHHELMQLGGKYHSLYELQIRPRAMSLRAEQ
jgi:ATP-binding cassette subfamily B multidrug efflux pump